MTDVTIHDDDNPDGRPATDEEVASLLLNRGSAIRALDVLAAMTAADGTNYLDIFSASLNSDDD